jgi:hypothetical protein
MHGEMSPAVGNGLGTFFLLFALMNAYYTLRCFTVTKRMVVGFIWTLFTIFLAGTSFEYYRGGVGLQLSEGARSAFDAFMGPINYFLVCTLGFAAMLVFRKQITQPFAGWVLLNASILAIGLGMTDVDFRDNFTRPDNIPITMLIYSVGFTTWIALRQAVINDERMEKGQPPVEAEGSGKVLTWPDLVYTELLAMILCTIFLIVWSIMLKAPLEPPASDTKIPNPSKAPWYFLGLQEMLVYFDPWLAGVLLPSYIILGLCAMPYIDHNTKGNGYYCFKDRWFAITTWLYGFLVLWVVLIILGTFLRGPNWNFFGFFEKWTPYKTESLNNINLSDIIWVYIFGQGRPQNILIRELFGLVAVIAYFAVVPMVLARTFMRKMFLEMGFARYMTMVHIFLMMASLPIKMVLRWTINLKYIVAIPEFFFNI